MLTDQRARDRFLSGALGCAGGAVLFFIAFFARELRGVSVLEWYIPAVVFTALAVVLVLAWYAGGKESKQAKLICVVGLIAAFLSSLVSIVGGVLFLN